MKDGVSQNHKLEIGENGEGFESRSRSPALPVTIHEYAYLIVVTASAGSSGRPLWWSISSSV